MPAVAAISTGLPSSTPGSSTSKNVLNSPEYDAENTGVTTTRPSARRTFSIASASSPAGTR